jgi:hypothetical protein
MGSAVDSVSFQNIAATTAAFKLNGGYYMVAVHATAYGTNGAELQALGPDQSTWLSLPTALKRTTDGMVAGYAPAGQYRFTLDASATGVYCSAAGVPISS